MSLRSFDYSDTFIREQTQYLPESTNKFIMMTVLTGIQVDTDNRILVFFFKKNV